MIQLPANTLAVTLATAAFFSGGSVSPPGMPPVAPRPFITGRLIGLTVYLCSVKRSAARYKQHLREYLSWGRDIAAGKLPIPSTIGESQQARALSPSRMEAYWDMAPLDTVATGALA
jgi:hypothetical protein